MRPLEEIPPIASNRTRFEILADILKVASNSSLKTHIMYKVNLSHRQLEKYLEFLITNQLLEETNNPDVGRRYRITQKGIDFLKDYSRLESHLTKGTI